ncbi:LysR family transcriptional regulator [Neobacillus sp. 114]|uniref:LysR family transcriptional regulator n=1 Tax=Neobacillus sp. 114 TaxID=3048535 RepID=UPI0024C28456|nr:LysR family transcriptional regulator [Neobacillus sp. 114]
MDIRQLKYFETAVRNKNITKAAEELHISQPSLSVQIKSLEQELSCKLLERNTKEISLTEPGKILYNHACDLLVQFENIYRDMEDVSEVGSGEINVGMFQSASSWFPKIIMEFQKVYPNLRFKIHEIGSNNIENALRNYDIHLGISSRLFNSDIYKYSPFFKEELLLITNKDHLFKKFKSINISDLINERFILYKQGYKLREIVLESCENAGFKPKVFYECGNSETMRNLVLSGLGVAIVPETSIRFSDLNGINILKINNFTPSRTLYTVLLNKRYHKPVVLELNKLIINFFGKLDNIKKDKDEKN